MSPWLRSRTMVWLSPHGLVAAHGPRAFTSSPGIALYEEPLTPLTSLRDWSACVSAFEVHWRTSGRSRAAVSISLSDHFVRYACLAWRPGLRGARDWEAYALHELERRYGIKNGNAVRIAPAARAAARVAVAIDAALLERLRETVAASGSRLASLEANACRVANRYRRALGHAGRLLVAERQRWTCFTAVNDRWTDVQSVRAGGIDAWASLQLQARLQLSVEVGREKLLGWGIAADEAVSGAFGALTPLQPPASTPRACVALGLI